jgi:hypothetical protein
LFVALFEEVFDLSLKVELLELRVLSRIEMFLEFGFACVAIAALGAFENLYFF